MGPKREVGWTRRGWLPPREPPRGERTLQRAGFEGREYIDARCCVFATSVEMRDARWRLAHISSVGLIERVRGER